MNEKKVEAYLKLKGLPSYAMNWDVIELKKFLRENSSDDWIKEFSGFECGCLRFSRAKSGRRYIQFLPGRCYID